MFTLRNVNFKNIITYANIEIRRNATTFICGESGSGKSTLLKLLNGIISPTSGEVIYSGKNINEYNPVELRREILLCGQSVFLFEGSVRDNFTAFYKYRELPVISDSDITEALRMCAADFRLDATCDTMSGGEKQRVFIAICLSFCPKVLLLDEPTGALDDFSANTMMTNIKAFCREQNITLIMISHNSLLAETYGDTVITLKGRAETAEGGGRK